MKNVSIGAIAVAATLVSTSAFAVDVGVGIGPDGIRVGPRYRDYEERRYFRERPYYRNRADCRTITIERSDGSVVRKYRCD